MGKAKVTLSNKGVAELLKSREVEAYLTGLAETAASYARATAPVASGAYRDSIAVETEQHPSRVVARVVARVPYATAVEASTGNLARSIDSGGG